MRGTGWDAPVLGCDTNLASHRGESMSTRVFRACESGPSASSNRKLSDSADARNLAAGQVPEKIAEILLQFRKRLALGQVIGEFLKISEPHASVLPVNVTSGAHDTHSTSSGRASQPERNARQT